MRRRGGTGHSGRRRCPRRGQFRSFEGTLAGGGRVLPLAHALAIAITIRDQVTRADHITVAHQVTRADHITDPDYVAHAHQVAHADHITVAH